MNRSNESVHQPGNQPAQKSDPALYEVWLDGRLDARWASWFGATEVRCCDQGHGRDQTRLLCPVADQAALYGLLRKLRDLGLSLAALKRIESASSSE